MSHSLDGKTILRFAFAFKKGGGTEKYIDDLDSVLLKNNNLNLIRLYLESDLNRCDSINIKIENSKLILFPIHLEGSGNSSVRKNAITRRKITIPSFVSDYIIYNPFIYNNFASRLIKKRYPKQGMVRINSFNEVINKLFIKYQIDLVVMHNIGSTETSILIEQLKKRNCPYVFINHYSNKSFSNISFREQLPKKEFIASVSVIRLPNWLKECRNLSDGINLDFFKQIEFQNNPIGSQNLILYPARICKAKNQYDLIKTFLILKKWKIKCKVAFAGRIDSNEYYEGLKSKIESNNLQNDITFLGNLNENEMKLWYSKATLVAFPTYHQEGLGRILVEAQAMQLPVVSYNIGGTPEAVINNKTGFLVRCGDVKQFARKIRFLLKNQQKRVEMGKEGRKFVEKQFSLNSLAKRHEDFYVNALKLHTKNFKLNKNVKLCGEYV